MNVFQIVFACIQACLLLTLVYLYLLAVAGLWPRRSVRFRPVPRTKFAILVPAHNESKVILRTLDSIKNLSYPLDLYDVYVIADNCTDDTATITRKAGVSCLERRDKEKKGKGYALQWVFNIVNKEHIKPNAYVIIDADTVLAPDFLQVMDAEIQKGGKALQGYYDVLEPDSSVMASLTYFGFALNRHLRYTGRTRLGLTSNLLGNGMCFHRKVIEDVGWPSTSIVEDIEYEMILLLNGIKVIFVPKAKLYAEIPKSLKVSKVQRTRWDLGKFSIRNRYVPKLLKAAIHKRDVTYLDAALELLLPPFPLYLTAVFSLFLLFLVFSYKGFDSLFLLWLIMVGALIVYTLTGIATVRANGKIYRNLLCAPYYLFWRVFVAISGMLTPGKGEWRKTGRENCRERSG